MKTFESDIIDYLEKFDNYNILELSPLGGMADALDLKSSSLGSTGSSPVGGTLQLG